MEENQTAGISKPTREALFLPTEGALWQAQESPIGTCFIQPQRREWWLLFCLELNIQKWESEMMRNYNETGDVATDGLWPVQWRNHLDRFCGGIPWHKPPTVVGGEETGEKNLLDFQLATRILINDHIPHPQLFSRKCWSFLICSRLKPL